MRRIASAALIAAASLVGCAAQPPAAARRPAPPAAPAPAPPWTDFRHAARAVTPDPAEMGPLIDELWHYSRTSGLADMAERALVHRLVQSMAAPGGSRDDATSFDGTGIAVLVVTQGGRSRATVRIDPFFDRKEDPNFFAFADLVSRTWHIFTTDYTGDEAGPPSE